VKTNPMQKKSSRFNKLIAIVLALALWFYVAGQGQMTAKNDAEVDLNYINLSENLTVSGPDNVTVKMWGTIGEGDRVEEAYVDLSGLGPGTYTLPVSLQQTNRALLAKVEPDKVKVVIAEMQKNILTIVPRAQNDLAEGFELTDIFTVPEQCSVQGDKSAISSVQTVIAPVTIAAASEMQSITADLKALDKDGNIIEGVRLIPAKATVYAVVSEKMASKKLPLKAVFEGDVAEGLAMGEVVIEPLEVLVAGNPDLIENLSEIETKTIDVSGYSKSITVEAELSVPEGVKVYPSQAEIYIEIKPADAAQTEAAGEE